MRRDALRILRAKRANKEAEKRQQAHETACRPELENLQRKIDECTSRLSVEDQRHAQAVAELHSERRELDELRAAILRPLADDGETSKHRLAAVLGERSTI